MNIKGNNVILSKQEFKNLVEGKFEIRQCVSCYGQGWYWVHEDGTKRNPLDGENLDKFYKHECCFNDDECKGLGFHLNLK